MIRPTNIKPLDNYKIWLRYSDQTEGVVDLSHLVGRGVFKRLKDRNVFKSVYISEHDSIAWGDDIELCSDSLYMKISGQKAEDLLPGIKTLTANA